MMRQGESFRQMATFAAIGAFNTAAYFVLALALDLAAGLGERAAAFAAYGVLLPVSFFGHRRLTFRSRGLLSVEGAKFCLVQATNLGIIWIVTALAPRVDLPGWASFAAISVLIPLFNFVVFRRWVFARRLTS